jgi:hypothetical protein
MPSNPVSTRKAFEQFFLAIEQGRPIYIQHLGAINYKKMLDVTTEERMIRFHVQEYERCARYIMPACSIVAGRHIDQTFAIIDVKGAVPHYSVHMPAQLLQFNLCLPDRHDAEVAAGVHLCWVGSLAVEQISMTTFYACFAGVGLKHLTGEVKRMLSKITSIDQNNYPEMLGHTCIINAPSFFKLIWKAISSFIDPKTQEKIEV